MLSRKFRQFLTRIMSSDLPPTIENSITISGKKSIDKVDVDEQNTDSQAKRTKTDDSNATLENLKSEENRIKKRKYALLIGYCGEGYFGLQRYLNISKKFKIFLKPYFDKINRNPTNKEFRTIEDEIVDGLVKINSIPQNHADEMYKVLIEEI
jgi:hypothetical protein